MAIAWRPRRTLQVRWARATFASVWDPPSLTGTKWSIDPLMGSG